MDTQEFWEYYSIPIAKRESLRRDGLNFVSALEWGQNYRAVTFGFVGISYFFIVDQAQFLGP